MEASVDIIKLPASIKNVTYRTGALWVAVGEEGTVVRIDPTTNAPRTYEVGQSNTTDVDVRNGLVAVGVRQSEKDATGGLEGRHRARGAGRTPRSSGSADSSADPALFVNWDEPMMQFQYATCAKLYNYPDLEGEAGKRARARSRGGLPAVSDGGRAHADPNPKGLPVLAALGRRGDSGVVPARYRAQTVAEASTRCYFPPQFANFVGAEACHAGKAPHISGIATEGDTLVIRLVNPAPDLQRALALSVFCAVPEETPIVPHGLEVADLHRPGRTTSRRTPSSVAVLKRNPNSAALPPSAPRRDRLTSSASPPERPPPRSPTGRSTTSSSEAPTSSRGVRRHARPAVGTA